MLVALCAFHTIFLYLAGLVRTWRRRRNGSSPLLVVAGILVGLATMNRMFELAVIAGFAVTAVFRRLHGAQCWVMALYDFWLETGLALVETMSQLTSAIPAAFPSRQNRAQLYAIPPTTLRKRPG